MAFNKNGLEQKIVKIKQVNKTTKSGRHMRFSAVAIVGDRNGNVGYGKGRSLEVPVAMRKAVADATKNLTPILRTKKGSVYHDVIGKKCGSTVLIKPAPVGTGLIAGGPIRAIIELAGFKDVYTKSLGSNSPMNIIYATIEALKQQKTPHQIAVARGKKQLKDL